MPRILAQILAIILYNILAQRIMKWIPKGLLVRKVYCKWKVKRIPKGRWKEKPCNYLMALNYYISGCRRKNYWVSST